MCFCVFYLCMASLFIWCFLCYGIFSPICFEYRYQCKLLPGKTRLLHDLLCVEWDVKLCSLTHSTSNGSSRLCFEIYSQHLICEIFGLLEDQFGDRCDV